MVQGALHEHQRLVEPRRGPVRECPVHADHLRGIETDAGEGGSGDLQQTEVAFAERAAREPAVEESAPVEIRTQIASARKSLQSTSIALRKSRDEALALQKRVVALQSRVTGGRDALEQARDEVLTQILSRNQSPIWDIRFGEQLNAAQDNFEATVNETGLSISEYAERASTLILLHVILILLMGRVALRSVRTAVQTGW